MDTERSRRNAHRQRSVEHIAAVKAAAVALRDEYAQPRHDRATVADLQAEINRGLKLAEVEAVLAVAEEIATANEREKRVLL